jgi:hypothetical protein
LVCVAIYRVGRSLQRKGHDLNFVDPRYPDSMQAAPGNRDVTPPGRPSADDDTSLFLDDEKNPSGQDRHGTA